MAEHFGTETSADGAGWPRPFHELQVQRETLSGWDKAEDDRAGYQMSSSHATQAPRILTCIQHTAHDKIKIKHRSTEPPLLSGGFRK